MLKKSSIIFVLICTGDAGTGNDVYSQIIPPGSAADCSLTRIAHEETDCITPYLDQDDEIGHLAGAIEKLRVAMEERGYLQRMHDINRERLYFHDSLTGLPNRVSFGQALDKRVNELHPRKKNRSTCC